MGSVKERFIDSKMFHDLKHRSYTMAEMIGHLETSKLPWIVETGTARITGNWGGDGQSTLVWDWVSEHLQKKVLSIDMNLEAVNNASAQTKNVKYICADSVQTLNNLDADVVQNIGLLYLDSFDWAPEIHLDSSFHHMAELAAVWRYLPSGCLIVVDDRHSPEQGKHFMVAAFMDKLGIEPLFAEYQIGWIKP
jgi:hypothetical protein